MTDGRKSLEVVFGVIDYPNVSFQAGKSFTVTDWRPYGALLFDAYNPDDKPLQVSVRIDDSSHHNWTTGVELPPKKQVRVCWSCVCRIAACVVTPCPRPARPI